MYRTIEATVGVRAERDEIEQILRTSPGPVLSDRDRPDGLPGRTIRTSLRASVGSTASIAHAVVIEMGRLRVDPDAVSVSLRWAAADHDRFLPEFEGAMRITSEPGHGQRLIIEGTYGVPLGRVGRFGDSLIGHRVARSGLEDLARSLARRLEEEADRRRRSISYRPAPYNEDLRRYTHHGHHPS